ncbi:MAG: RNA methyltransferase substrate-binding domain-containing protein, partial [Actinomycetes bacterium]
MAGNSQRKGARRTPGSKKGATVGSGGRQSKGLRPKGPTPRAQDREKATKRSGSPGARAQADRRATPAAQRSAPAAKGAAPAAKRSAPGAKRSAPAGRGAAPTSRKPGRPAPRSGAPAARGGQRPGVRPGTRPGSRADPRRSTREGHELVVGRNSVVEALRAQVPATALYIAERIDTDERVKEALRLATDRRLPLLEAPRAELDRMSSGSVHQGLALQVPPYAYA